MLSAPRWPPARGAFPRSTVWEGRRRLKVSTRVHYGLRAMTELARAHGQGLLSLAEISRTEMLPLAYLEQLIGELRRAGLVEGVRGLHGGYRLDPPALRDHGRRGLPRPRGADRARRVHRRRLSPTRLRARRRLPLALGLGPSPAQHLERARLDHARRSLPRKPGHCDGAGLIAIETITGARAAVKEGCLKTP